MKKIDEFIKKYQTQIDRSELCLMIAHVLRKNTSYVLTYPEHKLNIYQQYKLKKMIAKRKANVPLAYLFGHKEFFGIDFQVNKNVLIPRPETELIVEDVLKKINSLNQEQILLIDVGTGSGCIPIAILKNTTKKIKTYALDTSKSALRVAKKNALFHQTDIYFKQSDLLSYIIKQKLFKDFSNIVITANLPYITELQFNQEISIQHEPKQALVADDNGLALYKTMLLQVKQILSTSPSINFYILMEIDPDQTNLLSQYIETTLPNWNIKTKTDLCGRDRLVVISNL